MPRALVVALWIGVAAIAAYWGVWFLGDRAWLASLDTPVYIAFENAFPAADAWLALTYAASAIALQRQRPSAVFWLIAAGSASLYLAAMDILFDVQHGVYTAPDTGAVATEIAINAASVALGAWTLGYAWRHRRSLLGLATP